MSIISKQKASAAMTLGWSSRFMGLTSVRAVIIFFALLHNPVHVLSVTLPGSYSVALAWEPSPSANVTGYRVYYGSTSGNYTNSVVVENVAANTVSGLASGVIYYFAVTPPSTQTDRRAAFRMRSVLCREFPPSGFAP